MLAAFFQSIRALNRLPGFSGLLASTFFLGTAFSFAAPFLSKWGTEEIGLTPSRFGLFMTATSLAAIAASTVLARLSDTRATRRQMLLLGSLSGTIGFLAYALIHQPIILLGFACTAHATASICFAQLFSHVREAYLNSGDNPNLPKSSLTMSVVRVGFSFSWTIGPALGSLTLISFGFRGLFLSAAALYFIFFLGMYRFVPARQIVRKQSSSPRSPFWKTLTRPHPLVPFLAFAAVFAANAINMLNLPLAITRSLNGSERDFGIVFAIGPIVEIPLMLWFGQLAGRGYQTTLIRIGFLITLLYFLGLSFADQMGAVYFLQILSGASFAILTNIAILYFQDLLPEQLGLATSLFSNAGAVGNLIGMLSFGFIVESLGHHGAFACCAVIAFLALLCFLLAPSKSA